MQSGGHMQNLISHALNFFAISSLTADECEYMTLVKCINGTGLLKPIAVKQMANHSKLGCCKQNSGSASKIEIPCTEENMFS